MSLVKNKFGLSAEHETAYLSAIMVSQLSEVISERLRVIQRLEGELDEAVVTVCKLREERNELDRMGGNLQVKCREWAELANDRIGIINIQSGKIEALETMLKANKIDPATGKELPF